MTTFSFSEELEVQLRLIFKTLDGRRFLTR